LNVRDALSGQELLTLRGHSDSISGVAYSPDGKRLATASTDRTVKVSSCKIRNARAPKKGIANERLR
jgi:WD40 repeat protein